MRVAALLLLLLLLVALAILGYSDTLNPFNPWALAGPAALLLSIPISLSLFALLWHRQQERRKQ